MGLIVGCSEGMWVGEVAGDAEGSRVGEKVLIGIFDGEAEGS